MDALVKAHEAECPPAKYDSSCDDYCKWWWWLPCC